MNAPDAATYRIVHRTAYRYDAAVSLSQQLLHLTPRATATQACLDHSLDIDPAPTRQAEVRDAFGNTFSRVDLERPHEALTITARSTVRLTRKALPDPERSPPCDAVREHLTYRRAALDAGQRAAMPFLPGSPFVPRNAALADYARDLFQASRPLLSAADALMQRIHDEFIYDTHATHIATPLMDVLATRRGVCQDFAHLMLGCLRSLGFAARYVSGYLRSAGTDDTSTLVGADASHAWVSVHCPTHGWVDFDPTNRMWPDTEHVILAWGRDFGDVSPLRGVILGGGEHHLDVGVSMRPMQSLEIQP